MQTTITYTRLELEAELDRYRKELGFEALSSRSHRRWRSLLGCNPDQYDYYWHSDLESLKALARGLLSGRRLEKIAQEITDNAPR